MLDQKLWAHQVKAIEMARTKNLALLLPPGTGKTRCMIEILREEFTKKGGIQNTLIFSPLSVCNQWKEEFKKYSEISPDRILVLTQSGRHRTELLTKQMAKGRGFIAITNYESVQIKSFYEQLLKWSPFVSICDEAHRLKDSSSVRARKIYPLTIAATRRFIMTGTIAPNSLLDVYGQYQALYPGIFGPSFWQFKNRFFEDRNAGMPAHVRFPNWQPKRESSQIIGSILSDTSIQAKKEDCLDLPPLLEIKVPVGLGVEQAKCYREMLKEYITELEGTTSVAEFSLTKSLRLRQIMGGFVSAGGDSVSSLFKDNPRIDALRGLLQEMNGAKVIIWATFKTEYKLIAATCKELGLSFGFLTGEQNVTEKQETMRQFQEGDLQVIIANPQAASEGINLHAASYAIYYTRDYSQIHFEQSRARNYRGGSEIHPKITHYFLVATGTIDEVISEALLNKKSVAKELSSWIEKISLDKSMRYAKVDTKEIVL